MATVNKDFKVKHGLIVEGTTATVNNYDVLTKKQDDQDYIVNLIGGTATSQNTPDTVVKRDGDGDFSAGIITADLVGDVTGTVSSLSNHSTSDLSEGTNKYFTNQRAVDANTGLWDEAGLADAAYNNAVADAASDATSKANAAEQNAKNYADGLAVNYDAAGAAASAQAAAESYANNAAMGALDDANAYTDTAISNEVTNRNNAIDSAITNLNLGGTYDALGAATTAENNAKAYTDTEIAALVDSAPAMLDTLNELAAAIADNPNYATDVANLVATKADTTYVDGQISNVDGAAQQYASSAETAAKNYADGLAVNYDAAGSATNAYNNAVTYVDGEISALDTAAQGYATTAENNAKGYADSLASNYDAAGSASTAQSNAESYTDNAINALNTDAIEEGAANQYFTSSRAKDAAATLLTGATLTNIQITGTGAGLTITAENGVADSTTDDLVEGNSNLYFTDQRAIDALQAVTPNFTEIDINSVAKQVASTLSAPTAGIQTAYSFAKADYRSAEFLVKVAYGTHTEISKVMLTLDTSDNIAITEYAIVGTNGSASSISAGISGSNVQLQVTTVNNNSEVTVVGTLLA